MCLSEPILHCQNCLPLVMTLACPSLPFSHAPSHNVLLAITFKGSETCQVNENRLAWNMSFLYQECLPLTSTTSNPVESPLFSSTFYHNIFQMLKICTVNICIQPRFYHQLLMLILSHIHLVAILLFFGPLLFHQFFREAFSDYQKR